MDAGNQSRKPNRSGHNMHNVANTALHFLISYHDLHWLLSLASHPTPLSLLGPGSGAERCEVETKGNIGVQPCGATVCYLVSTPRRC
jgi:hypothetical protein